MLQQATAQPIPGIGVRLWGLTKPRVVSLIVFTAVIGMLLATPAPPPLAQIMAIHAIIPVLVCFVTIAYEIPSNQPGPPLWP